ncbi:MAG TPA: VOC family protein [Polyangiaceae bacterium]|nr:VOC family protein [Polyangiaceae bacterium]
MTVPKLHRVILFAKDLKRMLEFYHDALGLPLLSAPGEAGWAELDAGGSVLALHAIPPRIARDISITTPPRAREETPLKLVFAVDDVAALRRHLSTRGGIMFEAKASSSAAASSCEGLDPEGNVFQIVSAAGGR